MSLENAIVVARFGLGAGPLDPSSPEEMLEALNGPDRMAEAHPVATFAEIAPFGAEIGELGRATQNAAEAEEIRLRQERRRLTRVQLKRQAREVGVVLARAVDTRDPFRERLVRFWADHFTVRGNFGFAHTAIENYVEEAIRPNVTGRFADLLKAVTLHPMMLLYLDQARAIGPNSDAGRVRPGRGLNENLARELLELHTLGADGGYSQKDVRQLAELLSGLTVTRDNTMVFVPTRGEPGPEEVLGRFYGRREPMLEDIHKVLDDLAVHRDTARHIARKLAVHFVSDTPDPALVSHVARRFNETDGDLAQVYAALVEHPAARVPERVKAKLPWEYIATSLRSLAVPSRALASIDERDVQMHVLVPLADMGQPWEKPNGPDGWPEEATYWISPQGLAGRIGWAMGVADTLAMLGGELPDPRNFADVALGPLASETVRFAARAAETRQDGVALVLLSPEFQRK